MKKYISLNKFRYGVICSLLLAAALSFSSIDAHSQFYRKKGDRGGRGGGKAKWKKNVVWLEGFGSSQIVSVKYERIMHFGPFFSVRFDAGITPFLVDEKYNFIAGRSITPITGMGLYFNIPPTPVHIGLGCSVLHDIFFQGIPETADTSGGVNYSKNTYRARVMPFAVVEGTIKEHWSIRGGYSLIIDPANHNQTETYITHWFMLGVGYKFGN